jgi:hypothetical protein
MAVVNFIKHVGKHGDRKVLVLYRQVPGEDHMCLVIYPDTLLAHWQDAIQKVVESDPGQQAEELADALHRSFLPDGRAILQTLHNERMIKKIRCSEVIMTPRGDSKIRLDELNKMLNEMKLGEAAVRKMAENDASRGLVDAPTKRAAEAEFKAGQQAKADALRAPQDGALTDRDIAANMVFQAKKMELEAKAMISEAARMKKDAQRMDPGVVARETVTTSVNVEAPKKRTRGPNKPKTAVAADAQ